MLISDVQGDVLELLGIIIKNFPQLGTQHLELFDIFPNQCLSLVLISIPFQLN